MNGSSRRDFKSVRSGPSKERRKPMGGVRGFFDSMSLDAKIFISTMSVGGIPLYVYFFMKNLPTEVYLSIIPAIFITGSLPVVYFSKDLKRDKDNVKRVWMSRFLSSFISAILLLLDILYLSDIFTRGTLFDTKIDPSYAVHFVFLLFMAGFGFTVFMLAITEENVEEGEVEDAA